MAQFFINRPIFAWVIALFILVMGGVAITQLPISQYPPVAPPSIVISAGYPGASAQTLEDSVLSVIEREMNGSPGLIYMESVAQANGTGSITVTFETGTNPDLAQVDVQNRLSRAAPRLPAAVNQQGVRVDKARSNFLLFTMLSSDNPDIDIVQLGDFASRNILPEIQRPCPVRICPPHWRNGTPARWHLSLSAPLPRSCPPRRPSVRRQRSCCRFWINSA